MENCTGKINLFSGQASNYKCCFRMFIPEDDRIHFEHNESIAYSNHTNAFSTIIQDEKHLNTKDLST